MLFRWTIRTLALLLPFTAIVLWIASHYLTASVQHKVIPGHGYGAATIDGGLYLASGPLSGPVGFSTRIEDYEPRPDDSKAVQLGFNLGTRGGVDYVRIPFWFLTLIALFPLVVLWPLTTRPNPMYISGTLHAPEPPDPI